MADNYLSDLRRSVFPSGVVAGDFVQFDGSEWVRKSSEDVVTTANIKSFGALCNGTTDDTTAVQAAVTSLANADPTKCGGGRLFIPANTLITDTIVLDKMACIVEGNGWGDAPGLIWGGPAGIPMIQITDSYGVVIRNLWLAGDYTAPPSAAINYHRHTADVVGANGLNSIQDVCIGPLYWQGTSYDGDVAVGILVDGDDGNNDKPRISNVLIHRATTGISFPNAQSIWGQLNNVVIANCTGCGFYTQANTQLTNVAFNRCAIDIQTYRLARVVVNGWYSEHSELPLHLGETSSVVINSGVIRVNDVTTHIVNCDPVRSYRYGNAAAVATLVIKDVSFDANAGTALIALKPAAGSDLGITGLGGDNVPRVELTNVRGLVLPTQLDIDPVDANDVRQVKIHTDGYDFDGVMRWPDHASVADPTPADAIADSDTNTTNLMNALNSALAVLRANECIEWPEDPDSVLLGDNEGWYSAATQGETAGNPVASLTDYSGNTRPLAQATGGYQPTARGSGAASYFEFDGSDDWVAGATAADWQFLHETEWTVALVVRIPVADPNANWTMLATWDGDTDHDGTYIAVEDRTSLSNNDMIQVRTNTTGVSETVNTPNDSFDMNTWHTLIVWRHSNVITIEIDGVVAMTQAVAAPVTGTAPAGALRLGSLIGGAGDAQMDVAEVALWSRAFSRHWLSAIRYHFDATRAGL